MLTLNARPTISRNIRSLVLAVCSLSISHTALADIAGKAIFILGDVKAVDTVKTQRALHKGDSINAGETIVTSLKGQVHLLMSDGGMISIRPNSEFRIDEYRYDGDIKSDKGMFSLVKGGFRSITGAIGHTNKAAYGVKTPVATIGIRGTDYVARLCAADCGASATQDGLYVTVLSGGIAVANAAGSVDVSPGQFGYVAGVNAAPSMLPSAPDTGLFSTSSAASKLIGSAVANNSSDTSISDALSASRTDSVIALPTQGSYNYSFVNPVMTPGATLGGGTLLTADFSQMTISGAVNINTSTDNWSGTTGVMKINSSDATFGGNFSNVSIFNIGTTNTTYGSGTISGNLAGPTMNTTSGLIPSGSTNFAMTDGTSTVGGSATLK